MRKSRKYPTFHRSFCLNGRIELMLASLCLIPSWDMRFALCIENYTGAHCEEVFPPSSSIQTKSDLFAAFVTLTVLLGTLIIGTPYFLLKKGHLQRAISVQDDIDLAETSSTGAHHSFQDIGRQKTKDHDL
uniref:Uncharacterized protein n=1 Tax=Canis lupus familiaris TaxID=9615 RepID=A0A8P0TEY0_CANLF